MIKKFILTILFCLIPLIAFSQDKEILSQRTYNQKVYDLGKDARGRQRKNYKIHTAHIHYKDGSDFKDIDTTLIKDTNGWHQEKASYHCQIPEYSDDWFEFYNAFEGVNHTIQAKPIAEHIKGEYFKDKGQGVIYKDSFGKGIDLKVYAYWAGLKKVIIINEKPIDTSKDLFFDFELELPLNSKILNKDNTQFDYSKTSAQLDFTDKTIRIGDNGKYSYFRNALMWDSNGLGAKVNIQLYTSGGKLYLRKTIPAKFLQKAVYPIYTDHPTNYTTGVGDGDVYKSDESWDAAHDAEEGEEADYEDSYTYVLSYLETGYGELCRIFMPIDTSGINDGDTIDSALFYFFTDGVTNDDDDGDDWINILQTSQASTSELVIADYDQCGSINNPTEGATRLDISDIDYGYIDEMTPPEGAWNYLTLNATGKGWIDKAGVTKLGIREGHDCIDSPCENETGNGVDIFTSESNNDPYLDVTTSGGAERRIIFIQ